MSATGAALRDEGTRQLELAALWDPWPQQADRAIEHLARMGSPFTADDVRELVGDPDRPNMLGARFLAAARAGLIVEVGHRRSDRTERHRGLLTVWRGVT